MVSTMSPQAPRVRTRLALSGETDAREMLVEVHGSGTSPKDKFPKGDDGGEALAVIAAALADIDALTKTKLMAKQAVTTFASAGPVTAMTRPTGIGKRGQTGLAPPLSEHAHAIMSAGHG